MAIEANDNASDDNHFLQHIEQEIAKLKNNENNVVQSRFKTIVMEKKVAQLTRSKENFISLRRPWMLK